jgi:tRNA threonylcarbamoyladenosine biosynthesis protein TsaE
MDLPCECQTPEDLHALGVRLAGLVGPGAVLGLVGPLGAGKTQLVKGIAAGVGFRGEVTSPTFTLLHEYRGGRVPVFHFDFYRVEEERELLDVGWDELVEEGVVVAEWADLFPKLMPGDGRWFVIEPMEGGGRRVRERDVPRN